MKAPQGYLTAAEVKAALKITEGEFYSYVRTGALTRHQPPGKRYNVYAQSEVDALREGRAGFSRQGRTEGKVVHKPASMQRAQPADMLELASLIEAVFGTYPNIQRWTGWLIRNPDTCFVLRVDGDMVGCAFMQPLSETKIAEILASEVTPPTAAEEIGLYEPGAIVHLYIRTVGIHPEVPRADKRLYGARLVRGLWREIIRLGTNGVDIRTITARSETGDGIRLLKHLGFTEIWSSTSWRNFQITVRSSGLKMVKAYRAAFDHSPLVQGEYQPLVLGERNEMGIAGQEVNEPVSRSGDHLPEGYMPFNDLYKQMGVNVTTAKRFAESHNLLIRGEWRIGGHRVELAIDEVGAERFRKHFGG